MANQVVKLKKGSDYLYPYADYIGIDTNNIIANNVSNPYTATQDCCFISTSANQGISIDGVLILSTQNISATISFPLKKGQIVSVNQAFSNIQCKICGLKY